jgi:prepilin peptidase CpaA
MAVAVPLHVAVVLVAVLITAVTDLWKFKVHNVLTLPLLAAGLIYAGLGDHPVSFASSVQGALLGFVVLFPFCVMGGVGAGDVKLMTAVGAWLGLKLTIAVFLVSCLAAGMYALGLIIWFRTYGEVWANLRIAWHRVAAVGRRLSAEDHVERMVTREDCRQRIVPFAAMVAIGLLAVLSWFFFGAPR